MSFQVTTRTDELKTASKVFREIGRAGGDTGPLADAMGNELAESARHRLAVTNESPDGEKWPDSARVRAKGGKTQYHRGHLAGSVVHRAARDRFVVGSSHPGAAMRQFGGTIRPRNARVLVFRTFDEKTGDEITVAAKKVTQPARPYIGISSADEEALNDLAAEYFEAVIGRAAP